MNSSGQRVAALPGVSLTGAALSICNLGNEKIPPRSLENHTEKGSVRYTSIACALLAAAGDLNARAFVLAFAMVWWPVAGSPLPGRKPPAPGGCNTDGTAPTWLGFKQYETQSLAPFVYPVVLIFFALMIVRLVVFHFVLPGIANFALGPESGDKSMSPDDRKKHKQMHRKFTESGWRSVMYGFASVWVISSLLLVDENKEWMYDSRQFWDGYPFHSPDGLFGVYALYFAMYMHELVFVFIDTSGDDFAAMVAHHIVTIALLAASWSVRLFRVGGFITSLHDVSDFLLMAAKCFNYAKVKHPLAETIADGIFVAFTVSFYALRLGVYPSIVLRSALFGEACEYATCVPGSPKELRLCVSTWAFWIFATLLGALQLLQCLWGWKLAKAVYRKVVMGELTDVREE